MERLDAKEVSDQERTQVILRRRDADSVRTLASDHLGL